MTTTEQYLRAYDQQLRTDAETPSAITVSIVGPLRLVTFAGGRGFITYQDLGGADAETIVELVAAALKHFVEDPQITHVEWKSRGHDVAPGLHEALLAHGFVPDEPESIMIGPLETLATPVPLPQGVSLRCVTAEADVRAMSAMADEAFGEPVSTSQADALLARLARNDGMELWCPELERRMVSVGRLEPVPGTDFVGIWGGATLEEYRGRGIYRALTAARAQSAIKAGKTLVHSDSTEYSRPILERSGLIKVSTTTPYNWTRTTPQEQEQREQPEEPEQPDQAQAAPQSARYVMNYDWIWGPDNPELNKRASLTMTLTEADPEQLSVVLDQWLNTLNADQESGHYFRGGFSVAVLDRTPTSATIEFASGGQDVADSLGEAVDEFFEQVIQPLTTANVVWTENPLD